MNEPSREPSTAELIDAVTRKLVTVMVIAAALIALAIYMRPGPPRYLVAVGDGRIVRIDTRSGTVIACEGERCATVLRHGQHLEHSLGHAAAPLPAPAAQPALPAPAPAASAAPAPAPVPR